MRVAAFRRTPRRPGSSPTRIVSTTAPFALSMMLIESETWFTTQTSFAVRTATETGSTPTGISFRSEPGAFACVERVDRQPVVRRVDGVESQPVR